MTDMDKENDLRISSQEFAKNPIVLGTPAYGGLIHAQHALSVYAFNALAAAHRLSVQQITITNESLITRARNNIVEMFLNTTAPLDNKRVPAEYLFFLDADIEFKAEDALTLIAWAIKHPEMEVVAASYPKKGINWQNIQRAVLCNVQPKDLPNFGDLPVINMLAKGGESIPLDRPIEVSGCGTGFMLIKRSVFLKMKEHYPNDWYVPDYSLSNPTFDNRPDKRIWTLFDTEIYDDPQTGTRRYLSEDYSFCRKWRAIGGKVYICPWISLKHYGTYAFVGDIANNLKLEEFIHEQQKARNSGS